ncbi:MAG: single-stranded DNA-binding protein [Veillonellaceae bacterium]|nr:MAG: single-stranded DNA-binding protein [Veillonellaceae bacterium]
MNSVQVLGNLTRDPQIRATKTGRAVASFSVACDRMYNDKKLTDWINVVAWGKLAEAVGNLVRKGDEVLVQGRMGTRKYTAKDGTDRYITEVTADFIGKSIVPPANKGSSEQFGNFEQFGKVEPEDGAAAEQIPF